jgi:dTDP-4-dehydrorhamnose 3,5-epimerase
VYAAAVSFPWRSTPIPGAYLTSRPASLDDRGSFTKVLGEDDEPGVTPFVTREVFWSSSQRGVFRGMHLQLPPRSAAKVVFVVHGAVRDFLLDLRRGSPTEGQLWESRLDSSTGGLVVPDGCAHGFEVVSDEAIMVYLQADFHSPEHDGGVEYRSAGVVPAAADPIISSRDAALPLLQDFESPFEYA